MAPLWSPRGKCRDTTGGPQCWGHGGGGRHRDTPPRGHKGGDTMGTLRWRGQGPFRTAVAPGGWVMPRGHVPSVPPTPRRVPMPGGATPGW